MNDLEKGWLAAAIDGEGSIGLYDYGKEGRRLQLTVTNTVRAFVEQARRIVGHGWIVTYKHREGNRKPIYHFNAHGRILIPILKELQPYFIVKKSKLDKILKELEEKPLGFWTPEVRAKHSVAMKKIWSNSKMREDRMKGIRKGWAQSSYLLANRK